MSDDRRELHRQSTTEIKEPKSAEASMNKTSRFMRLHSTLGFKQGYNFVLWLIFGGTLFAFCLARLPYLHPPTLLSRLAPGEGYWFRKGVYKTGMLVHLATVLPAGIIAVTQFIPAIRHKAMNVHRVLGYISMVLLLISTAPAFVIMRRSFGGDISTQSAMVFLGALTSASSVLSWVNIKRLQIDQHRKWMLRTWFYASSIITLRIVMIITARVISAAGQYYTIWNCAEISYALGDNSTKVTEQYPACPGGQPDPNTHVAVLAKWSTAVPIGSSFGATFGAAAWMALLLHIIGVEIYIHLTPGETARLRKLSYHKQRARGMINPGSMGTVGDRIGDNFGVAYNYKLQ